MKDKDNDLVVIKANEMIQKYKYTLSKTELRVVNTIISNINSPLYDEELNVMTFDINEFCHMLGLENGGGSNYKILRYTLRNLSNKSSDYINFGEYETIVRWIDKPKFEPGTGMVKLKLDDDLKPFLLRASGTISAKLKYYFEMDSKYSMRLYELLKSWDGFQKKKFEVEDLKASIDALKKSYANFAMFKRSVLDPAVEEINNITDLKVSYSTEAKGRKVTHIEFKIQKKNIASSIIDGDAKELPEEPPKELPEEPPKVPVTESPAEFEGQTSLFDLTDEPMKYSEENALYGEGMGNEFTDEEVSELVKLAMKRLEIVPFGGLNYDEQMQIYDYLTHYYQSLKLIEIKTTRFNTLRNRVLKDYDGMA